MKKLALVTVLALAALAALLRLSTPVASQQPDLGTQAYTILQARCYPCHTPGGGNSLSTTALSNLNMLDLQQLKDLGPRIISRIQNPANPMPPKEVGTDPPGKPITQAGPLSAAEIQTLAAWVNASEPAPMTPEPACKSLVKGDLNGDGKVTTADVTLALRAAVGLSSPSSAQMVAADVDDDGRITVSDITVMLGFSLGLNPDVKPGPCVGVPRPFISNSAVLGLINQDLQNLAGTDSSLPQRARYFLLTSLWNNPNVSDGDLVTYRKAFSLLINSLSWDSEINLPAELPRSHGTILRIDLDRYHWTKDTWNDIIRNYPYAVTPSPNDAQGLQGQATQLTGTPIPAVRADWFCRRASRELYYELLDMPQTEAALETTSDGTRRPSLNVSIADDCSLFPGDKCVRFGILTSGVARFNRILERHPTAFGMGGYEWISLDFASQDASLRSDIQVDPVSPKPDAEEIIFSLPNGLQGYCIADASGRLIQDAIENVVVVDASKFHGVFVDPNDNVVHNAISCASCHSTGLNRYIDTQRSYLEGNPPLPGGVVQQALKLYPGQSRLEAYLNGDSDQFSSAVQAATALPTGASLPDGTLLPDGRPGDKPDSGSEAIATTVGAYDLPNGGITLDKAAAELGLPGASDLQARLKPLPADLQALAPLLSHHGFIKRASWERLFPSVAAALHLGNPVSQRLRLHAPGPQTVCQGQPLTFQLSTDNAAGPVTFAFAGPFPQGATLTPTGTFTWTPGPPDMTRDFVVSFQASDSQTSSDPQPVMIHVHRPPVLSAVPPTMNAVLGKPITFTVTASDLDGAAVTLGGTGTPFMLGAMLDPHTGVFIWTPLAAGDFTVTFTGSAGCVDATPVSATIRVAMGSGGGQPVPPVQGSSHPVGVLVVRGADNGVYYAVLDPAGSPSWSAFAPIHDMKTLSAPAVAATEDYVYAIVRGMDNHIYMSWTPSPACEWHAWIEVPNLHGASTTLVAPCAVAYHNRLVLFVRGTLANDLWYNLQLDPTAPGDDQAWTEWRNVPNFPSFLNAPSAAVVGRDTLVLCVRGQDEDLVHYRVVTGSSDPGSVFDPTGLEGNPPRAGSVTTVDTPRPVALDDSHLALFVRAPSDSIYENSLDLTANLWSSPSKRVVGAVSPTPPAVGLLPAAPMAGRMAARLYMVVTSTGCRSMGTQCGLSWNATDVSDPSFAGRVWTSIPGGLAQDAPGFAIFTPRDCPAG